MPREAQSPLLACTSQALGLSGSEQSWAIVREDGLRVTELFFFSSQLQVTPLTVSLHGECRLCIQTS